MVAHNPLYQSLPNGIVVRHHFVPGDLGALIMLHGVLYDREYGYDQTFEAYVAGPLAQFVLSDSARKRIWILEQNGRIVGCIAVVEFSKDEAQLRWFLLDPEIRGLGLGRRLMEEALAFCREAGYRRAFLMTFDVHTEAATLYRSLGFFVTEEHRIHIWGKVRTEQRYDLNLVEE